MLNIEAISSSLRRWARFASELSLAMDADPSELLQEDIRALKDEVIELRRKIGEANNCQ